MQPSGRRIWKEKSPKFAEPATRLPEDRAGRFTAPGHVRTSSGTIRFQGARPNTAPRIPHCTVKRRRIMKKAIILGGGFAGTTIAHLLAREGWQTTILEKEQHLGGGCRTFFHGGHPFTYGPRVYYGYSDKVFKWLDSFVKIRRFPFELQTYVEQDGRFYSYPIHETDIPRMRQRDRILEELEARDNSREPKDFEEYWINRVGPTLYNMFVNQYSKKMWMVDSNKVFDIFKWSAKDKPIETGTREAYKGSYIGYPVPHDGYNSYFDQMTGATRVIFGEHIRHLDLEKRVVKLSDGSRIEGDILISTIPIDELCNYVYGELPYAGRDFTVFVLPCRQAFPATCVSAITPAANRTPGSPSSRRSRTTSPRIRCWSWNSRRRTTSCIPI